MNKSFFIVLPILLCSCSPVESSIPAVTTSKELYIITVNWEIGLYPLAESPFYVVFPEDDTVGCFFPKAYFQEVDFDHAIAGDLFQAEYTSESKYIQIMATAPSQLLLEIDTISYQRIVEAHIVEIEVLDGEIKPIEGIDFSEIDSDKVIGNDKSFHSLSEIERGFAAISAKDGCTAKAVFSYNPRS